jgi:peptidoglycan/xylan/chitin deacetylase (PgdA/CDA1 family)
MSRRPLLIVLTYHRIAVAGITSNPYYDHVISGSPELFQAQVAFLASRFNVIHLPDLLPRGIQSATIPRRGKPALLLTFDDGYRDNYEIAIPILRELGVPATFFLTSGFLERPRLPWWDHVAYAVKQTTVARFGLQRWPGDPEPIGLDLGSNPGNPQRAVAIMQIVNQFLTGLISDERWFLAQLDRQAEVTVDQEAEGRALFMGWDELYRLGDLGMSVGSHGHEHRALGQLDEEAQTYELAHSKHLLEAYLQREVAAIAYPFGWRGTFTNRTQELAARAGYQLAFSSLEGINHPSQVGFEPFCLRRLNVGTGDFPALLRARIALHAALGRSFL